MIGGLPDPITALNSLIGTLPVFNSASGPAQTEKYIDPTGAPLWEADTIFLNPYAELPKVKTWAKMGERPCFPKQGVITIDAKPKQGKSLCAYAAMIPLITGKPFGSITPNEKPNLVIVFDTEMSEISLQPRYRAFRRTAGDDCNNFLIVPLLATPKSERWKVIEDVTAKYNPGIIIIDHISKLVDNYNDPTEASAVSERLSALKADRTVFVIIHQNKSKEDANMRGAVGSAMNDDQCEAYTAAKKDGVFTLSVKDARDTDSENAPGFFFAVRVNEENEICEFVDASETMRKAEEQKRMSEAERWRQDLALLFGGDKELRYTDLRNRIMERQGLAERAAKDKIQIATKAGAIERTNPDKKRSPYRLTPTAASDFAGINDDEDL